MVQQAKRTAQELAVVYDLMPPQAQSDHEKEVAHMVKGLQDESKSEGELYTLTKAAKEMIEKWVTFFNT